MNVDSKDKMTTTPNELIDLGLLSLESKKVIPNGCSYPIDPLRNEESARSVLTRAVIAQAEQQRRIADALERIAEALRK